MNRIKSQKTVDRNEVVKFLADELKIAFIRDYCPNGLQVEGQSRISSIVSGVTASLALIEAGNESKADTILVHHGYFWRNENACITGPKQKRSSCFYPMISTCWRITCHSTVIPFSETTVNWPKCSVSPQRADSAKTIWAGLAW